MFGKRPLADFQQFVETVVAAINKALVNIPRDKVRLHVCWGNYEGPHDHDVPFAGILPILLRARVGGLYVPFANPRHAHEYKVLRNLPLAPDQVLVAGVIDTVTNYIEHPWWPTGSSASPRPSAIPPACWQAPTAGSIRQRAWAASPRTSSGRSSPPWSKAPASLRGVCLRSRRICLFLRRLGTICQSLFGDL